MQTLAPLLGCPWKPPRPLVWPNGWSSGHTMRMAIPFILLFIRSWSSTLLGTEDTEWPGVHPGLQQPLLWDTRKLSAQGWVAEVQDRGLSQDAPKTNKKLSSSLTFSSVQFSRSVVSDSLRPHGLQHARPPCPAPTLRVHPNPCPLPEGKIGLPRANPRGRLRSPS